MSLHGGADRPGRLFVCATPLGNLEDVSFRLLRTLTECTVIAAEDTRVTRKLLARYEVHTPLVSCHQHSPPERIRRLVERLRAGQDVALVCTAGTPTISDPGSELVRQSLDAGVPVLSVPGPSAVTAALSVSGLPTARFWFQGFLPRRGTARKEALLRLANLVDATLVLYEAPQRVARTLTELAAIMGDRPAVLCRELTKKFEETRRGTVAELAAATQTRPPRGECTLVIGPVDSAADPGTRDTPSAVELTAALQAALAGGLSVREAVRHVVAESGAPRNLVYHLAQMVKEHLRPD